MKLTQDTANIKTLSGLLKLIKNSPIHDITTLKYSSVYQIQLGDHDDNLFIQLDMLGTAKLNITERHDISRLGGYAYDLGREVNLYPTKQGKKQLINFIHNDYFKF